MSKCEKISKPSKQSSADLFPTHTSIDALITLCQKQIPSKTLSKYCAILEQERCELRNTYKKIIETITSQPLLAAYIVWAKECVFARQGDINFAKTLLEYGYIKTADKNGKMFTIAHAKEIDHYTVLNAIRSTRNLPPQMREHLVMTYVIFIQWLAKETQGYIHQLEDPDLEKVKGRVLLFPTFIALLGHLRDREQLIAKLLYFDGNRTLDEVLHLNVDQIDHKNNMIRYPSEVINYPSHVFNDLQKIIESKKSGRVFVGRQNAPLNASTIFRNFKEAAVQAGIGSHFSPSILTAGT